MRDLLWSPRLTCIFALVGIHFVVFTDRLVRFLYLKHVDGYRMHTFKPYINVLRNRGKFGIIKYITPYETPSRKITPSLHNEAAACKSICAMFTLLYLTVNLDVAFAVLLLFETFALIVIVYDPEYGVYEIKK